MSFHAIHDRGLLFKQIKDVGVHDVLRGTVDVLEEIILDDVTFLVVLHALVTHLQVMIILEQLTQHTGIDTLHLVILKINVIDFFLIQTEEIYYLNMLILIMNVFLCVVILIIVILIFIPHLLMELIVF